MLRQDNQFFITPGSKSCLKRYLATHLDNFVDCCLEYHRGFCTFVWHWIVKCFTMPKSKSSKKGATDVEESPSPPKCESCKTILPRTMSLPAHPMCGRCTVDNDVDHFTLGYGQVKCTACATLPQLTYRDYRRKATFYRDHGEWASIRVIQERAK